jgi:hypothetical protein
MPAQSTRIPLDPCTFLHNDVQALAHRLAPLSVSGSRVNRLRRAHTVLGTAGDRSPRASVLGA